MVRKSNIFHCRGKQNSTSVFVETIGMYILKFKNLNDQPVFTRIDFFFKYGLLTKYGHNSYFTIELLPYKLLINNQFI